MGEVNTIPMRINKVEGAAGQVKLSGGPGAIETWGAPAPAAHTHAAGDVTSGQFPLARMPRAATGNFLEGNGVGADPIFNALAEANIPNHMSKNKLAWTVNTLLQGAGAGVNPTEISVPTAGIWTLATTLTPAASASEDTGVITAHDLWMIIVDVQLSNAVATTLKLRFNNDAGNNYDDRYLDGNAVASGNGVAQITLCEGMQNYPNVGVFYVRGHRSGNQNYVTVYGGVASSFNKKMLLSGHYQAGVADVTRFQFICTAGNMTGKIFLYYKDY